MSLFSDNFDRANTAFGAVTTEDFQVVKNGALGIYTALSIDDLTTGTALVPGGFLGDTNVIVHVTTETLTNGAITDGSILLVRNQRVRVADVTDDGDNAHQLHCTPTGAKLPGPLTATPVRAV